MPRPLVFYGPQRNPNEPPRYLYNKDLFFLKNGNTEEKKYILSLHKINAGRFPKADLEEKMNRWVRKEFKNFNEDARLSIQHWKDSWHKRVYKKNQRRVRDNPKDYFSNHGITEVIKITTDQPHGELDGDNESVRKRNNQATKTPRVDEEMGIFCEWKINSADDEAYIPKRPLSFQHIIKLDHPLANLKFANKGSKDPVYGMPIPDVMLNNVIKALADYSEYLAKSTRSVPTKAAGLGKGLITKDGVEFAVKKVKVIDDEVDSERTDEEEVVPLVRRRFTGVSIGREAYQETELVEEGIDHSKKLKGLVSLSEVAQYKLDMKKAQKASKDDFFIQQRSKGPGEGSGVTPEVPDVLTLNHINERVVEDISSDDDEVTEKADEDVEKVDTVSDNSEGVKIADVGKDTNAQVAEEQPVGH
ncbi:hypothetical protein Tco_0341476 [Tanacetum coccineum]